MRKRSFLIMLVVFVVLVAAAFAIRPHGTGLLTRLMEMHGQGGRRH